jgi:hypothetical protein
MNKKIQSNTFSPNFGRERDTKSNIDKSDPLVFHYKWEKHARTHMREIQR